MTSLINYIYYSIYGENAEPNMNTEPKRKYGWKNGETYGKTEKYLFDFGFVIFIIIQNTPTFNYGSKI